MDSRTLRLAYIGMLVLVIGLIIAMERGRKPDVLSTTFASGSNVVQAD